MNGQRTVLTILTMAGLLIAGTPTPADAGTPPTRSDGESIRLTLTLTGAAAVQEYATAVATPGHRDYRRTLTSGQLRARFGASEHTVARVSAAAQRAGFTITGLDATGTRLSLVAPAQTVQAALGVQIHRQVRGGTAVRSSTAPTRAPWPAGDVQAISGLQQHVARPQHVNAPSADAAQADAGRATITAPNDRACARYWGEANNTAVPQKYPGGRQSNLICGYTGAQLRALYGLGAGDTGAGQTLVIVGAYNDPNVLADANTTFAATGVPALPASRYTVKTYAPAGSADCDQDAWHLEQALDVQTAHTLAPAARIVYVAAGDCTQLEETLAAVVADATLDAIVVSNSWGILGEPDDPGYLTTTNNTLARAAILGIGTYFASGDFGDNSDLPDSPGDPSVVFPASSPWTTAVGGTTTAIGADNHTVFQTGWTDAGNTLTAGQWHRLNPAFVAGAGGGTSAVFSKPTWQQAVPGARRAVPDIAALADPYTGFAVGTTTDGGLRITPVGGTSLATPVVASLVVLAQARAGGDTDVGFLAPLLYANNTAGRTTTSDVQAVAAGIWTPAVNAEPAGDYLIDVNAGVQSLTTLPGYDRVTGLGTPGRSFLTDIVS